MDRLYDTSSLGIEGGGYRIRVDKSIGTEKGKENGKGWRKLVIEIL